MERRAQNPKGMPAVGRGIKVEMLQNTFFPLRFPRQKAIDHSTINDSEFGDWICNWFQL